MTTLTIEKTALPIIKSSLETRRQLLQFNLKRCKDKLTKFEKKHKMLSQTFYRKFLAGKLGDDAYLIEWEFYYECYQRLKDQLSKIKRVGL